ncbi:Protein of unknown function [Aquimarina amphilecti]|uniref:DUF2752 domain-containing protein n=1 Tax=Aquimarina amphilecti TaxID=1038014 RepID=A0A1H7F980_AQUAM|nr:Protein of unknown function [Aquimarina amphilecti]
MIPIFFITKYYYLFDPENSSGKSIFLTCPFHYLTGYHCPGCGSQRAIHDLLHGRIDEVLSHNLMFLVLFSFLIIKLYYFSAKLFLKKEVVDISHNKYYTYGILIFVIFFWALRNIPFYPFKILAP